MKSNQLEASKSNIAAGDVSTYDSQPGAANYRRAMNILTVALLIGALGAAVRTQDVQIGRAVQQECRSVFSSPSSTPWR